MCINIDAHLFGSAGNKTLVQPESLFLGETLSLVVPKQGTLNLSHTRTHTHRKQTRKEREAEMTGVYKAQCAGDRSICMVIRKLERFLIPRNKPDAFDLFSLLSR